SMSVDQNISLLDGRKILFIIDMSMSCVKSSPLQFQNTIICQNREIQNHLIHFRLTVSTHSIDLRLSHIEHGAHFLWRILSGQIISGTVIENISQQNQS